MLFFVLSGYLMGYLYLGQSPTRANIAGYAAARVGRVVPLFLAVVGASALISTVAGSAFRYYLPLSDPTTIGQALLFMRAPYELWTIPVEVQFYVVFALMWALVPRLGRAVLWYGAGALGTLAVLHLVLLHGNVAVLPKYSLMFMLGVLTAAYLPGIKRSLASRTPAFAGVLVLALVAFNLPILRENAGLSLTPGDYFMSTWYDPLTIALVYALFLCCVLNLRSLSFLDSQAFVFLGTISYGLYLLHRPLREAAGALLGTSPLALTAGFAASVALAWLSFRHFEQPVARVIRARARRRFPRHAIA